MTPQQRIEKWSETQETGSDAGEKTVKRKNSKLNAVTSLARMSLFGKNKQADGENEAGEGDTSKAGAADANRKGEELEEKGSEADDGASGSETGSGNNGEVTEDVKDESHEEGGDGDVDGDLVETNIEEEGYFDQDSDGETYLDENDPAGNRFSLIVANTST